MHYLRPLIFLLLILSFSTDGRALSASASDSATLFSGLRSNDSRIQLESLKKIYSQFYSSYPQHAYPYIRQAIVLARKLGDRETEASAYYSLGFYYQCRGIGDSALYCYQVGFDISKAIGSKILLARGYGDLGDMYRLNGDRVRALEYLKKSIALDSSNQGHYGGTCYSLGILYGDAGVGDKSVYYFLKALKIKEEQGRLVDAGYLCCNLAGAYMQSTSKEDGMRYFNRALDYFKRSKFLKGEGYVYNTLGQVYYSEKQYPQALDYFRKALKISLLDTVIVPSGHAFILTNIGDAWMQLGKYDSAQHYYALSLSFCDNRRDLLPLACTYLSLGDLNTRLKKYPLAIEYLQKGLACSKMINFTAQWEQAYNLLSECYSASGNSQKALYYLKKRNEVRDSIFTQKAHQEVANMMIKYETGKKDEQISALGRDKELQEAKARRAFGYVYFVIVLVLLLGTSVWIYYRRHLKPKVRTLDFIREKISEEREGDNRKLKALSKVLPPELKPFGSPLVNEPGPRRELLDGLRNLMETEKIYLDQELTLKKAAGMLNTNTTYLSRLINEHYEMNFSAFLNKYRVEEAKEMILDNEANSFSFEGIAKSAGFRSKSTFNQVFKSITGVTPSEFARKNVSHEEVHG